MIIDTIYRCAYFIRQTTTIILINETSTTPFALKLYQITTQHKLRLFTFLLRKTLIHASIVHTKFCNTIQSFKSHICTVVTYMRKPQRVVQTVSHQIGLSSYTCKQDKTCHAPYQSIHRVDHAASPSPEMHFGTVFSTAQGESLQSNPLTMDQFSKQFLITAVFVQIYAIINITTTF